MPRKFSRFIVEAINCSLPGTRLEYMLSSRIAPQAQIRDQRPGETVQKRRRTSQVAPRCSFLAALCQLLINAL